ncbi:MAG: hypothetical protein IPL52_06965 [Flavobacteriales bacterium]|nr:hypothetical protein [Flavobacteriales bacterium]
MEAEGLRRLRALLDESHRVADSLVREPSAPLVTPADLNGLGPRGLEFIRLVRHPANWSYEYIAVVMKLTVPTLHRVRRKVFAYFGVHSKLELVRLLDAAALR